MKLKITVAGVAYEVEVELLDQGEGFLPVSSLPPRPRPASSAEASSAPGTEPGPAAPSPEAGSVASPIAGTIVEVRVKAGQAVEVGQVLLVIEAMKMNSSIAAPTAGRVKRIPVAAGDTVREGQILVELE